MSTINLSGTFTQTSDGSVSINLTGIPAVVVSPPPVVTPPVTPPVTVTPPTTTPGSALLPIYAGFAKTGHASAPTTGPGIFTPPETPASVAPQGQVFSVPTLAMPTVPGSTYIDPVFGSTIRMLPTGMRNIYSQLQPFSDDETMMITVIPNVGYHVINYPTMTTLALPGFQGSVAPRWVPGSHKIVTTDYNWSAGGSQLPFAEVRVWDCDALTVSVLCALPFTQVNANTCEEDLSYDGQWMAVHGQDSAGVWHVAVVNLHTGLLGASIPAANFSNLDWAGASPLGNYLMVNSNGTSNGGAATGFGLELYDIKTGAFVRRLYDADTHLDHGLDAQGNEIVLTVVLASKFNNNNPGIVVYNMATGIESQERQITWAASPGHLSMQGPPGSYIIDSAWAGELTGLQPYEGEVYMLYGDGSTRRLCHHRSNPGLITDQALSYWAQVQAAPSRSGRLVAFATNWNTTGQAPFGLVIEGVVA